MNTLILLALILVSAHSIQQINNHQQFTAFQQLQSTYPILHVFYTKYFKRSKMFDDFIEVLEQTEINVKDFAKIVITDCEAVKDSKFETCDYLHESKQNRLMIGYQPDSHFLDLGKKKLQRAPISTHFNHPSETFTPRELQQFIQKLLPSYLSNVCTEQQAQDFTLPRYAPKVYYFTKEEDVPVNIKKLAVYYHLRFDFAQVEDLCTDIVKQFHVHKFPTILVVRYNYLTTQYQHLLYQGQQFDLKGYLKIKQFLQPLALKQPRNDVLFHTIKPVKTELLTVDNMNELWKVYDRSESWMIVQQSQSPGKITELKAKYSNYFSYLHFKSDTSPSRLTMYNPQLNQTFPIASQLHFNSMNEDDFRGNISVFLKQNYTVLAVREKYSHICAITGQIFFKELVECFIISDESYPQFIETNADLQFDFGFISYNEGTADKVQAKKLDSVDYQQVYQYLQYFIKLRLKQLMTDFIQDPIRQIQEFIPMRALCNDPKRKCVIALLDSQKAQAHKTELGYLREVSQDYFSAYKFFWVERSCNSDFLDTIDEPKATVFIYEPVSGNYAVLKQKINKPVIIKFLKRVHKEKKGLKQLNINTVQLNMCRKDQEL